MRSSTVFGKATGIAIRAATKRRKFANVFASHLDPLLTSDDLSNYLHDMLKLRPTVLLVKATNHYSSFHIQCECDNPVVFLSDTIWPEGSLVQAIRTLLDKRTEVGAPCVGVVVLGPC